MGLHQAIPSMTVNPQAWHVSISGTRSDNAVLNFTMSIGNEASDVTIQQPVQVAAVQGTKRPYSTIHDVPSPPLSSSPSSERHGTFWDDTPQQYFDDGRNSDFELIRVPKKRSYDLVRVPKTSPETRDEANVPLTATRYDGAQVVMWAKMDTGADTNFINLSTLKKLVGEEQAEQAMYPLAPDAPTYNLVGANHIDFTHKIDLSFDAGKSRKHFENVSFVVYPDVDALGSSTDGVPNVIIGIETLQKEHMVMVDFEYHVDHDLLLEVISPKAESENPEFRTIGPIRLGPRAPGVVRR